MIEGLVRTGLRVASPGGTGALSVLIYHRVLPSPDPLLPGVVDAELFDVQVTTLNRSFHVMPLREAVPRLAEGSLPSRAASITFDDGYADNEQTALPILQRHGVAATFFIACGYLDGGFMWNDGIVEAVRATRLDALELHELGLGLLPVGTEYEKQRAIVRLLMRLKYLPRSEREEWSHRLLEESKAVPPTRLMMRSEQVRALHAAGMDIGGHTVSHPILTKIPAHEALAEIAEGRERLEAICGDRVRLFAYPNGRPGMDYGPQHVRMVKQLGFEAAVSTGWGAARKGDDLFQLPRFTPWGLSSFEFQVRLGLNIMRSRLNLPSPPYWELTN